MNLPMCPHGNEGVRSADADPISIHADGTSCNCAVFAHDEPAATRAWAALCSPVTDERLLEIVENATPHHDACKPLDGWCSAPCRFDRQERYDIARAVRDACEGKP